MTAKALPVYVYRRNSPGDSTNGGISSRFDTLICLCDNGFLDVDLENPPENLVHVVRRHLFGSFVYHIEPVARPSGVGWMAGGNFAQTSDSRFYDLIGGMYGAVSIHDRQESREMYDLLSR